MGNKLLRIAAAAVILGALALPNILPRFFLHLAIYISIMSIAVIGLGILGVSGQISCAQGAFFGIGAYTYSLLAIRMGMSFWTSLPFVVLLACVVGFVVGLPTIKVSGLYLIMTTLGVNEIVHLIMMNYIALTGGPQGLSRIPAPSLFGFTFNTMSSYFYLSYVFLLFFALLAQRIFRSRLGSFFIAVKNSEIASSMNGVNVVKTKLTAFVFSAVYGGIAGALYAGYIGYIHPYNFITDVSILFLTMAIFGGQRSVWGMISAAAFLTIATEYFRFIGDYRHIAYGLVLILGMTYMPDGIGGMFSQLRNLRKIGKRA